jgi:hypothetical protein
MGDYLQDFSLLKRRVTNRKGRKPEGTYGVKLELEASVNSWISKYIARYRNKYSVHSPVQSSGDMPTTMGTPSFQILASK